MLPTISHLRNLSAELQGAPANHNHRLRFQAVSVRMLRDRGGISLVPGAALMLHADPQLVHFREVEQQELQRVVDVATLALKFSARVGQQAPGYLPFPPH